jgi:hypothetical protein
MPIHDWTRVDAGLFHDFHQVFRRSMLKAKSRPKPWALARWIQSMA